MNQISITSFKKAVRLDRNSDIPAALARAIELAVEQRTFVEDCALPSAGDIARAYEVSPATIRNGLAQLVDRGVLTSKRGPGGGYWVARKESVLRQVTEDFVKRAKAMGGNDDTIAAALAERFPKQLTFSSEKASRAGARRFFGTISSTQTDIAERHDHYLDDTTRE